MLNLLTKPARRGSPAIPRDARAKQVQVTGMRFARPPMVLISDRPAVTYMAPAHINSVIFKNA